MPNTAAPSLALTASAEWLSTVRGDLNGSTAAFQQFGEPPVVIKQGANLKWTVEGMELGKGRLGP